MGISKPSFVFLCFTITIAFVLRPCFAQNSPQDYLSAYNSARSQVDAGAVTWNTTLEAYAQSYANQRVADCNLVHSNGPYGENLAKGTGSFTGTAAVNLWVAEKPYYDYASNNCTGGYECRHYTQVVWRNSVLVGCARVQCTNTWWFVICSYDPHGNYIGQRPY